MDAKRIEIYKGNNKICCINLENFKIDIIEPFAYLYFDETSTLKDVENFLSNRVFPNRHDESTRDALNELKIPYYDVESILKKTNGKMLQDDISVKLYY